MDPLDLFQIRLRLRVQDTKEDVQLHKQGILTMVNVRSVKKNPKREKKKQFIFTLGVNIKRSNVNLSATEPLV